jgi:hypothetical protein
VANSCALQNIPVSYHKVDLGWLSRLLKIIIPTEAGDHTFSILVSEIGTALQGIQSDITAMNIIVQTTNATTSATRNELDGLLIEADDGTGKAFTAESLENASTGGGGGLTVTQSQTLSRIDASTYHQGSYYYHAYLHVFVFY